MSLEGIGEGLINGFYVISFYILYREYKRITERDINSAVQYTWIEILSFDFGKDRECIKQELLNHFPGYHIDEHSLTIVLNKLVNEEKAVTDIAESGSPKRILYRKISNTPPDNKLLPIQFQILQNHSDHQK